MTLDMLRIGVALLITGFFVASHADSYTVSIDADDGAFLYVDGQPAPVLQQGATRLMSGSLQ